VGKSDFDGGGEGGAMSTSTEDRNFSRHTYRDSLCGLQKDVIYDHCSATIRQICYPSATMGGRIPLFVGSLIDVSLT
jgi:hypothetical protein